MHDWISRTTPSTVVLLGAGASQPSIPMAKGLTPLVLNALDLALDKSDSSAAELWKEIRPELEDLAKDVEYLYQAVETLTYQQHDPTRHWITSFKRYGNYPNSPEGDALFANDASLLRDLIASHTYYLIDEHSTGAELAHLKPLLKAPLTGIISLNYDLLVEHAAKQYDVSVSTGAQTWEGGHLWSFPDDTLPLLKMHGSVSWRRSRPITPYSGIPITGIFEVEDSGSPAPNGLMDSSLIFGGGNKLRPDGPWPALYRAFEDLLATADTLVVIGYSFRDIHVDAGIRRWAEASGDRRIINVDPYPTNNPSIFSSIGDLRYHLDPACTTVEGLESPLAENGSSRFDLIPKTAVDAIPEIFSLE